MRDTPMTVADHVRMAQELLAAAGDKEDPVSAAATAALARAHLQAARLLVDLADRMTYDRPSFECVTGLSDLLREYRDGQS